VIKGLQLVKLQVDDAHPVVGLALALARHEEEIAGAGYCDVPEANALAGQLLSFGGLDCVIVRGGLVEELEMHGVVRASMQKTRVVVKLGRRIDRDHDRPFEPFGEVHRHNRDRVRLRIGAPFDLGLGVCPVASHR
jgi:hypothetical protein